MTFHDAVRTRDFTVTGQLQLIQETDRQSVLQQAEILGPAVDAITVPSNPGGSVHMNTLVAAGLLIQKGVDSIVEMHCRDSNNIALRSNLLGARALGVTSLLIQRGEKLHDDYRPKTEQVYDVGSKGLIREALKLNDGNTSTDFFVGGVITAFYPKSGWRAKSLVAKTEAGVRFLQTQMCFDADVLRRYMGRLVELRLTHRAHVVVSLATLPTAEMARWVRDNVRGSVMPDEFVRRLAQSADPEQEGVRLCVELLQEIREIPGVGGVNLLTPGDVATIPAAIHAAGFMPDDARM